MAPRKPVVLVRSSLARELAKRVWVPGHWKVNRFGERVWVAGHWRKIR
jgi:hypothetical protein